ncbi:RecB-like helicase [Nitrosophilus kaiyonis]|uniref:RecB-like helicase n=1 Tax=Nitrosophilus kaiyonis TaxID=2930200 RepID=UPI0024918798|nr:RecB-like helicase [Nitrosophilus kaiyonis]
MERLLAYEASAGTGKTFALVVRYLSLLFLDVNPSNILALTFTNKAANEMRVKILNRLKNLKDSDELKIISQLTKIETKDILKKQPQIYKKLLDSDIKITTIDSFFTTILRKFAMHTGLSPDFSISSKEDIENLYLNFLSFVYRFNKDKNLVNLFLLERKKLKDIFSLFENLYENMVEIEFESNVVSLKGYEKEVFASFEKIKDFILNCPKASNRAQKSVLLENIDEILSKKWLEKDSLSEYSDFKKCFSDELDSYFFELKNALKSYIYAKESIYLKELYDLFLLFKEVNIKIKKDSDRLTFKDIAVFVYRLLQTSVNKDFLYFRLDSKIDHILIDEFQDTSILQYKLLEPFIEEIASGEGQKKSRSFFYVGDVKQSIYRFRGGFKELFYFVANRFHIKTIPMDTNYRSDINIVEFVNEIFEPKYKEFFGHFTKVKPNSKKSGYVEVRKSKEVLDDLVDMVKKLLNEGVLQRDIAILCFKNEEILQVEEKLKQNIQNIKVVTETSAKLLNQKNISAIVEFLKYIYFKKDIFLENFRHIFDIKNEIDIENYISLQHTPAILAKKIIKDFSIDLDENILKLIDILNGYESVGEFIFDLQRIDESVISFYEEGIKVLTIHKSKGLEFDHVIVLDRLGAPGGGGGSLVYDYDGIELKRVFFRKSGREKVDSEYRLALEKEKKLQKEDLLNSLYVAFTRAKHTLIVLQKEQKSAFEILNLKEIKTGEIVAKEEKNSEKLDKKFDFEEKFYGLQNIRTKKNKKIFTKETLFGECLHYILEMVDFSNLNSIDKALNAAYNRYGRFLEKEDFKDLKNRVENLLKNEQFKNYISSAKIYKEIPLSYKEDMKRLDLLIERDLRNIVIDYKSSKEGIYSHKKQLREYVEAVKKITKKDTDGIICYLLFDKIEFEKV